jgi:hypothetical protein
MTADRPPDDRTEKPDEAEHDESPAERDDRNGGQSEVEEESEESFPASDPPSW